jgi:hypothetical protein
MTLSEPGHPDLSAAAIASGKTPHLLLSDRQIPFEYKSWSGFSAQVEEVFSG